MASLVETPAESNALAHTTAEPESTSSSSADPSQHYTINGKTLHDSEDTTSAGASPMPISSPPYWLRATSHQRTLSTASTESALPAGAIRLTDNETSEHSDRNNACWAQSVEITDYVIVNGSTTNIGLGAFVVFSIRVETLNGSFMHIRKRYSEFDNFRNKLTASFPAFAKTIPELPPKSMVSKFRPKFLEKRRIGLQYFLNCILLNPEFSGSPVLKDFLFS